MRKKIIAGNWKMNKTPSEAVALINELKPLVANDEVDVVFCVPAIDLVPAMEATKGTNINIGAENMYFEESGAYTGEIAPNMLTDIGVKYVIIGHSERREYFAETDETVNKKVLKAFEHGITPIICCGETLEQREQGITIDFIRQQIKVAFNNVTADQAKEAVIAYEPIWAIGTGKTATSDQAEEVCAAIRACIAEVYDEATAAAIRIQYGGSMNAGNAAELLAKPDIDGGLVGGASLKARLWHRSLTTTNKYIYPHGMPLVPQCPVLVKRRGKDETKRTGRIKAAVIGSCRVWNNCVQCSNVMHRQRMNVTVYPGQSRSNSAKKSTRTVYDSTVCKTLSWL